MTQTQAQAEAIRRWGPEAYVYDRYHFGKIVCHLFKRFYVGNPSLGKGFPYGNGNTWEEAFSNSAKN